MTIIRVPTSFDEWDVSICGDFIVASLGEDWIYSFDLLAIGEKPDTLPVEVWTEVGRVAGRWFIDGCIGEEL